MKKSTYLLTSLLILSTISSLAYLNPFPTVPPAYAGGPAGDSKMLLICVGLIPSTPDCVDDTLAPFETVVHDANINGVFDPGELVIVGPTPSSGASLTDEPKLRYRDANSDNVWSSGTPEPVFYDQDGVVTTTGDRVFLLGLPTIAGTLIKDDPAVKFADSNGNGALDGVVRVTARLERAGGPNIDGTQEDIDAMQAIYTYNPAILQVMRRTYPSGTVLPDGQYKTVARNHCIASGGNALDSINVDEAAGKVSSSQLCSQGPPRDADVGIGCDPLGPSGGVCPGIDQDGDGVGDVPLQDLDVLNMQFMILARGTFPINQVIEAPGTPGSKINDIDGTISVEVALELVNTVFDNRGAVNQPPVASFTFTPAKGTVGQAVSFDGTASMDPDGTIVSYSWTFGDTGTATGSTASHTYSTAGMFTVVLTVTDNGGASDTDTQTVTVNEVPNEPPTASFTFTPSKGTVGQAVSFDGRGSTDTDGTIVTYSWTFGDGGTATGSTATHSYSSTGQFTITLTVTDNDGATDTDTQMITVNPGNVPPTASFTFNPTKPFTGDTVSFDGQGSTDTDGTIVSYSWAFGDAGTATGATATHSYAAPGTYTVTLTVTDNDGAMDTDTQMITINPIVKPPPTAKLAIYDDTIATNRLLSGQVLFITEEYIFDASGSTDPSGQMLTYMWDFGDGTTATGVTATHTYTLAGTFTVTLTVVNESGGSDTDTVNVTVHNEPHLIRGKMSWRHHLLEGQTQTFIAKARNDAGISVIVKLKVVIESPAGTIVGMVESADTPLAIGETNLAITATWTPAEYGDITARNVYQITGILTYTAIDPVTLNVITGTDAQKTGSFAIVPT